MITLKHMQRVLVTNRHFITSISRNVSTSCNLHMSEIRPHALSKPTLASFQEKFESDPKNLLAQNACISRDPLENSLNHRWREETAHVFSHKVEMEGKPMTNQKSSGRCWIFACMNCLRVPFMKHYDVEEFEFSQNYLFFWDKVERCNYALESFAKVAREGVTPDSRLVTHLLSDPTCDGGQWDMLVNLIKKYGVMPKKCWNEAWSAENSRRLNTILKTKLREFCSAFYKMVADGATEEQMSTAQTDMMETLHRIISICLGTPPDSFTWEVYNKKKEYIRVGPVTPLEFYENYVKSQFDVDSKACLINDPRSTSGYNQLLTVEYLNNMVGGRDVLYNNQPINILKKVVVESIKNDQPVWFGCDVGKHFWRQFGSNDMRCHDYQLVFNTSVRNLTKAERLMFGESLMTHAMVITAVSLDKDGNPIKYRVENSWGEKDIAEKGYLVMTDEWFTEYVYEVVVDKAHIDDSVMSVFKQEPKVLPPWDPMGALAHPNTMYPKLQSMQALSRDHSYSKL